MRTTLFALIMGAALLLAPPAMGQSPSATSQNLLQQGADLLKQGNADGAETVLRRAAVQDPKNALAWYYLGSAQLSRQVFRDAEECLEKALRLDDAEPALGRKMRREATDALGLAYSYQREFGKAKEVYRAAIARDSEAPGLRYNLACVCALSADRAGALSALRDALIADSKLPEPLLPDPTTDADFKGLYGDPLFLAALLVTVGPQPNDRPSDPLVREGARLLASGDTSGATDKLKTAVERDPESARAWFLLGGALDEQKDLPGAAAAFARALAIGTPIASSQVKAMVRHAASRVASAKLEARAYDDALAAARTAADADSFQPWPFYLQARAFAGLGQKENAVTALKKAYGLREGLTALDTPLPDPAKDPAFASWAKDPAWQSAVADMAR